jgi:hypothetical protein
MTLLSQPFVINPKQAIDAYENLINKGAIDVKRID